MMNLPEYIMSHSILYGGRLPKIKKVSSPLQPIYEAFTNSLEAIKILKEMHGVVGNGSITISIYSNKTLLSEEKSEYSFNRIEILDTGVGFDDAEFNRFVILDDNRKGFHNKGSGRVQFLHEFAATEIYSVYRDGSSSTGFRKRLLTLSKSKAFLDKNAIIRLEEGDKDEVDANNSSCLVKFEQAIDPKDQFALSGLTIEGLKENIISRYLAYFCENRNEIPEITLMQFVDGKLKTELKIDEGSIPASDKEEPFKIQYSCIRGKEITTLETEEGFLLTAFKVPSHKLAKNELKLTSKGEVIEYSDIKLDGLLPKDDIGGNRYLFLLSGDYIDEHDSDTRGQINIQRRAEALKKQRNLYEAEEVVFLDDIEERANASVLNLYDEINDKVQEKWQNIEQLQKMFLLDPETLESLRNNITITDTDDVILKKVYKADAEVAAKKDAKIKQQLEKLNELNPADDEYQQQLTAQVDDLVKVIPQQNRTALTHYVARRKLVLDLFNKIIKQQLEIQETSKKSIDEKLLHNLVFQQASDKPDQSDLWLVNEDFIYFKGTSEGQLGTILLGKEAILKDTFTQEEDNYRLKQEGDANQKRPDILLFPKEGKCIIIEFKSLETNISEHLNQINRYASLINNLSKDEFSFTTYYGYLVGENIDVDDVQDNDSDFISAHELGYLYRPHKRIVGKFGRNDGALYTEVIKYSTLLERALTRNSIFIEKITQ